MTIKISMGRQWIDISLAWDDRPRFVQNKAPKVTASDMSPAEWPAQPDHEWCPPGHGDLYPAMLGTALGDG